MKIIKAHDVCDFCSEQHKKYYGSMEGFCDIMNRAQDTCLTCGLFVCEKCIIVSKDYTKGLSLDKFGFVICGECIFSKALHTDFLEKIDQKVIWHYETIKTSIQQTHLHNNLVASGR